LVITNSSLTKVPNLKQQSFLKSLVLRSNNIEKIDDFAFERANPRDRLEINLMYNNISKISDKAFCSREDSSKPNIEIESLDLRFNNYLELNPCIFKQLVESQQKLNNSFKPVMRLPERMKCDCNITFLAHSFNLLESSCIHNGQTIAMSDFECNDGKLLIEMCSTENDKQRYSCENMLVNSNQGIKKANEVLFKSLENKVISFQVDRSALKNLNLSEEAFVPLQWLTDKIRVEINRILAKDGDENKFLLTTFLTAQMKNKNVEQTQKFICMDIAQTAQFNGLKIPMSATVMNSSIKTLKMPENASANIYLSSSCCALFLVLMIFALTL